MDKELVKLINEKGPEIAQQLQIATTQVYGKVLWYIQLKGVVDLTTYILGALLTLLVWFITYKVCKKYNETLGPLVMFASFPVVFGPLAIFSILSQVVATIAQIFYPEFYLINQILQGFNK